ncbi:MAG: helix-turn-helix transcriptional regulator [Pirellulales bacterium]
MPAPVKTSDPSVLIKLRYAVMLRGEIVLACRKKYRAEQLAELGSRDTPNGPCYVVEIDPAALPVPGQAKDESATHERVRQARKAAGFGLREYAEILGVLPSDYANFESGKRASVLPDARPAPTPSAGGEAIVTLSEAAAKLLSSRLQRRTILLLLKDATGLGLNDIDNVLMAAANMSKKHVRPVAK